jgi:hypothetical protein
MSIKSPSSPTLRSRIHHSNRNFKLKYLHKTHPKCAITLTPLTHRPLTSLSSFTVLDSLAKFATSLFSGTLTISTGTAIIAVVP